LVKGGQNEKYLVKSWSKLQVKLGKSLSKFENKVAKIWSKFEEKISSFTYVTPESFFDDSPSPNRGVGQNCIGKVGQNKTTPSPPNVDAFATSLNLIGCAYLANLTQNCVKYFLTDVRYSRMTGTIF
jgi:hypothetical protein